MSALFFIFDAVKTNWTYRLLVSLRKGYHKNERRVIAYLVCVAIATSFWFLNALSKTYTVDLIAPVKYVNLPNNKTLASSLPDQFELTIESHGFTILRHKINFLFLPLEFDVNELTNDRMTENKKSYFVFPTRQFLTELSYQISNDGKIININPDTLTFVFGKLGQKRLKVKPDLQLSLKKQYQVSGNITTIPDSVMISGAQITIDTMKFAYSQKYTFSEVDQSVETSVMIKSENDLFFEPQEVKLKIPVDEYTEAAQLVPVLLNDQPADVNIKLFPSKVKVNFLVGLSRFSEIHPEDFKLAVSYNDIVDNKQRLRIKAESVPPFLYDIKIFPEELEYLIEK
jgi:hypothetical protein